MPFDEKHREREEFIVGVDDSEEVSRVTLCEDLQRRDREEVSENKLRESEEVG